ncbi:MAG: thiol oxidoreductase [Betaproteobacteria bacterium]|nr:thiol oxidoreductase [Betaproteobacteria bacterium]
MKFTRFLLTGAVAVTSLLSVADDREDSLSAGSFTVSPAGRDAYFRPAPVLSERQRAAFQRGRAGFLRPWVVFGVSAGDWGLGPTFVADRCGGCHSRAGRGAPPDAPDEPLLAMVARVSVPGTDPSGGPRPLANYGGQIQNRALQGQHPNFQYAYAPVPAEADLFVDWEEHHVSLADGTRVTLRRTRLRIENPAFGALPADTMTSLRLAPPVFGLGLLEAVPEESILALAESQRRLGFAGRPNRVRDAIRGQSALGRFGWKATQPSVRQQVAAAALHDIGATSSLFPRQNCPAVQTLCTHEVPGNDPELTDAAWDDLESWSLGLGVPARRNVNDPEVRRGATVFEDLKCAVCHVPTLRTADYFPRLPELSRQTFHPYTDLLLHDMGEGLADDRPDFEAGGRDWRTPPLWGLGLSKTVNGNTALLHDGRARDVVEAILWHGGEAEVSRDAFRRLPRPDREALRRFLNAI